MYNALRSNICVYLLVQGATLCSGRQVQMVADHFTFRSRSRSGCKTISVSGIKQFPALNGLYDKLFECDTYPVFGLRDSKINLYYHITESRWVIGTPTTADGCDMLYGAKHVVGQANKLYPHMVESDWKEKSGGRFRDNPDIAVECDGKFYRLPTTNTCDS